MGRRIPSLLKAFWRPLVYCVPCGGWSLVSVSFIPDLVTPKTAERAKMGTGHHCNKTGTTTGNNNLDGRLFWDRDYYKALVEWSYKVIWFVCWSTYQCRTVWASSTTNNLNLSDTLSISLHLFMLRTDSGDENKNWNFPSIISSFSSLSFPIKVALNPQLWM